jgi:hypothetical protein
MDPNNPNDVKVRRIHAYDDRDAEGRKLALVYACRERWEALQPTENPQVKYCTNCSQPVFAVSDVNDFQRAVPAGRCVMVKPPDRRLFLGFPAYMPDTSGLKWEDDV